MKFQSRENVIQLFYLIIYGKHFNIDIYCSILRIKWFNIASQALLPDRTIIIKSIKECMNGEMQAYEEYV